MSNKEKIDQHQLDNTQTSKEKKVKDRLEQLYLTVKKHDISYYKDHNPSISDSEYDDLRRNILEIEQKYPSLVNPDSPSFSVGAEPSEKFKKVNHLTPMLSIQNAKNREEVVSWSDSLRNFLRIDSMEKIDYVACLLYTSPSPRDPM